MTGFYNQSVSSSRILTLGVFWRRTPDQSAQNVSSSTHEQRVLKAGAVCLITGSIAVILFRVAHGDLPTDTGRAALSYVVSRPTYPIVHFGDVLGLVAWTVGLVALSDSLRDRVASTLGRVGLVSASVGLAVHVTEFTIDGFALPMLAKQWATAAPSDQRSLESGARLLLVALGGPGVTSLVLLWGVTVVLYAAAVKKEGYSTVLGWTGIVVGVMALLVGTTFYLRPNSFPGVVLFGGGTLVAHVWTLTLGISMWHRAASPSLHNPVDGLET